MRIRSGPLQFIIDEPSYANTDDVLLLSSPTWSGKSLPSESNLALITLSLIATSLNKRPITA